MQFDVYATPGRAREVFPFLIDVQSDLAHCREAMLAAVDFMLVGY